MRESEILDEQQSIWMLSYLKGCDLVGMDPILQAVYSSFKRQYLIILHVGFVLENIFNFYFMNTHLSCLWFSSTEPEFPSAV